jgi:membrane-associated protein
MRAGCRANAISVVAYAVRMHMHLLALGGSLLDAKGLLEAFGVAGLVTVIFAETGLLIGFFLPGDSLLVLGGLVAAVGAKSRLGVHVDLWVLLVLLPIAAIAGAQVGYLIGRKAGPPLFNRPDSRLFKHEHVDKAQRYFDKYGPKTIVVARFIPIVRTFANPMAGVAEMKPRTFTIYNVIGGLGWALGVTMLGFVLGKTIPSAQNHLLEIEAIIIVLSLLPVAYELHRTRRQRRLGSQPEQPQRTAMADEPMVAEPVND